jgi:tetratricopeptide (TPR) repeat protein
LSQPGNSERRLDGWKAIAGYFRRDRTTVMRWARERQLPVHRLPGGKQGSVFAYEHELASWASRDEQLDDELLNAEAGNGDDLPAPPDAAASLTPVPPSPTASPTAASLQPQPVRRSRRLLVGAGAVLALALLVVATVMLTNVLAPPPTPVERAAALPRNPAVAANYVAARDLWARRTPEDLRRAIALYEKVIAADPDFAPAYAGLAEAWLIYREYGAATESRAYSAAKSAVEQALAIDSQLAAAHRANGFIQYWWSYDAQRSVDSFRRALALDPRDGLTHFWYANVLSDLGQDEAAQHEYDMAQLLLPGTPAIAVERACAHWQAGRDRRALMELEQLKAQYPEDATIRNCLAWAHISRGDIKAYAREYRNLAALRDVPEMKRLSAALDRAIAQDPATAHLVLVADARREFAEGERKTRMTPAFHASSMGDRATLVTLLKQASNLGERWYSATLNRRIAEKWRGDAEVQRLLRKVVIATPKVDLS